MRTLVVIFASLLLTGCCSRQDPQRCRVVLEDGMTWWGPTNHIAASRARWYCDPNWRRDENISELGYFK